MKSKYHRVLGFTLIELLVVISIISLLSSIVLASLKEVRQKAQTTKFRQEVYQFITALELYYADNNKYPLDEDPDYVGSLTSSQETGVQVSGVTLDMFTRYIKKIPVPTQKNSTFQYYFANQTFKNDLVCGGVIVPYMIIISGSEPGFTDWSEHEWNGGSRCFSIKK